MKRKCDEPRNEIENARELLRLYWAGMTHESRGGLQAFVTVHTIATCPPHDLLPHLKGMREAMDAAIKKIEAQEKEG